jgi:hypothetical protein
MNSECARSLRDQVQRWLTPAVADLVRVTSYGRVRPGSARYVSVEVSSLTGARSMYFFRHAQGCWQVYPPAFRKDATRPFSETLR